MKKKLTGLLIILAFIVSCTKEKLNNLVEGRWKWIETVSLVSPPLTLQSTIHPAAGKVYIFDFKADKKFTYSHNDSILRSGFYFLNKNDTGNNTTISFSDDIATYNVITTGDTLKLVSNVPGGGYSMYSKY